MGQVGGVGRGGGGGQYPLQGRGGTQEQSGLACALRGDDLGGKKTESKQEAVTKYMLNGNQQICITFFRAGVD